jgi:1-acyl-sn-glycerol-3-phosphate acyltransferase
VFFREIEVVGLARVPRGVPLVVVANHVNALVDPLLILAFLGLRPRILAKSTLWRHPVMAPLLVLAGGVPVYRRQDGTDMTRNFDTFRRCRTVLAGGGAVLLFPEGTSHSQPRRLPLKTGAARIALETEACHGPLRLRIIPVGLRYEAKGEFRSRVLIQVGDPIDPAPERERYGRHGRVAVQALTDRIARALDVVAGYGEGLTDAPPSGMKPARRALLAVPMAVGVALNWVPYRLPGWIADRLSRAPDDPATYKLLAAVLTFPLVWALETLTAGALAGAAAGLAVALLAPLTGLAALLYWDRPGLRGRAGGPADAEEVERGAGRGRLPVEPATPSENVEHEGLVLLAAPARVVGVEDPHTGPAGKGLQAPLVDVPSVGARQLDDLKAVHEAGTGLEPTHVVPEDRHRPRVEHEEIVGPAVPGDRGHERTKLVQADTMGGPAGRVDRQRDEEKGGHHAGEEPPVAVRGAGHPADAGGDEDHGRGNQEQDDPAGKGIRVQRARSGERVPVNERGQEREKAGRDEKS